MEHVLILAIIGCALLLFITEWLRSDLVAIAVMLTLPLTGLITAGEAFSGFSNPAVITVIGMFILSGGLVRTGVADWVAEMIIRGGGTNPTVLTIIIMLTVGGMSAFMNNIGAVAVMLPAMFIVAQHANYPVSRLLMPLSFGSLLGGLITVIGTPPNLLISMSLEDAGFAPFRLFDFAPTGLIVLAVGVVYMAFIGRRLIPIRETESDLTRQFKLQDYITEVVVPENSPLIGKSLRKSRIRAELGLNILRLIRKRAEQTVSRFPTAETVLQAGDHLVVQGDLAKLIQFKQSGALEIYAEKKFTDADLSGEGVELAEVVVAPNSALSGRTICDFDARRSLNILVLALKRRGQSVSDNFASISLEPGDVLLIQGSAQAIGNLTESDDFLVVSKLEPETRKIGKAPLAIGIMAVTILLAAFDILPIAVAAMLGAFVMTISGCLKLEELYRSVDWRVIFLIAGMIPLGLALDDQHTGTASWMAGHVVSTFGGFGPLVVLGALFLFTTLLTEVMSNAAAAVLLGPITISISTGMGLEPYPFLMAVAIGASTTFLSPIGHQSNVLIYGVGNYRFSDFARAGVLLNVIIFFVVLVAVPWVWPFTPLAK